MLSKKMFEGYSLKPFAKMEKKKKNLTKCTEGLGISEETYISSCGYVPAALFSVLLLDKRPLSAQFSPILLK